MPTARSIDSYRAIDMQSRTPLEMIVMLYDGALRFMSEARRAIERKDIPARRHAVSRALAIVSELQNTLDLESGGELAQSLDGLYVFVIERLTQASVSQEVRSIDEAVRVIATLRDGWAGITSKPVAAGRQTR